MSLNSSKSFNKNENIDQAVSNHKCSSVLHDDQQVYSSSIKTEHSSSRDDYDIISLTSSCCSCTSQCPNADMECVCITSSGSIINLEDVEQSTVNTGSQFTESLSQLFPSSKSGVSIRSDGSKNVSYCCGCVCLRFLFDVDTSFLSFLVRTFQ